MISKLLNILTVFTLLFFPGINFAQAPTLGTAADFVLFSTTGAISNTGVSHITGNVGTNTGAITDFGNVDGVMHAPDAATALCVTDLQNAYNQLNAAIPTSAHAPVLGNGETLNGGVYFLAAAGSLNLALNLDGQGDENAVFIFQVQGAFSTGASSQVNLMNGAKACNVFWKIEGLASMAAGTMMKGTVIANNAAIALGAGVTLEGRALSTTGAVSVNGVLAYTPLGCGTPVLTGPVVPVLASTACYALFSANGAVTNTGTTFITGDIGTNAGATSGYNALNVTGTIHAVPDASTAACAADLMNVYNYLDALPYNIELLYPAQFGNNLVLTPHTYLMNGPTVFTDSLYLNAQGNPDAVFVIRVNGPLSTSTYATVRLINGAAAQNVFWEIEGTVNISNYSALKGTIICNNGGITLNTGTTLEGRALTTNGTVNTDAITITGASATTISYAGSPFCSSTDIATVTRTGTAGGTYSSTAGLSINAATGSINLGTSTSGTYTVLYTIGCSVSSPTTTVTIRHKGTWTGTININWNNTGNWECDSIPDSTTNVIIPDSLTNYPVISNATNAVKNLTIGNGGSLTVNVAILQIAGTITNEGTFSVANGTIEMNGSSAQIIPSSVFAGDTIQNLTLNNNAGVTLNGRLYLTGIVLASQGDFNTGGYLTLISTAAQTALIDGSGTGEVLGNVTLQRYLATGFGYKYFSSPFETATVNEFADDVDPDTSFPGFYRYDENLPSSGWVNYTDTNGLLIPLEGYVVNMGALSAAKTVDITGVVNNHMISSPTLYNHNQPYTLGFNLIGNPYPSPVDWNISGGWGRTNIDAGVYYFNAGTSNQYEGTYSSYINGVSSDGVAGHIIASMQGFLVHVSNGTFPVAAALTINNNARINNLVTNFYKEAEPLTAPLLRLSAGFTDGKTATDAAVVYFDNAATRTFEPETDALKLMNTDLTVPNLYLLSSDAKRLSVYACPALEDSTDIVPLGLKINQTGRVTFNATDIERFPYGRHIYLCDAKTGVRQDLKNNPRYQVYLDAGIYENRFFLAFRLKDVQPQPATNGGIFNAYSLNGKLYAHISGISGEACNVIIVNLLGQVVMQKLLNGNGYYELGSQLGSGAYIVSFYVLSNVFSQKVSISNL
jgi:hypothetical protein